MELTYLSPNGAEPELNIVMLVAVSNNSIIGSKGAIPWHYKEDLAHFKVVTSTPNCAVIMGRKTYESIPRDLKTGEVLPGRCKIVLSRTTEGLERGAIFAKQYGYRERELLIKLGIKTLYVIGGVSVYEFFKYYITSAIVTRIPHSYDGDAKLDVDLLIKYRNMKCIMTNPLSGTNGLVVETWSNSEHVSTPSLDPVTRIESMIDILRSNLLDFPMS
jgi:dihydrofolate reductase